MRNVSAVNKKNASHNSKLTLPENAALQNKHSPDKIPVILFAFAVCTDDFGDYRSIQSELFCFQFVQAGFEVFLFEPFAKGHAEWFLGGFQQCRWQTLSIGLLEQILCLVPRQFHIFMHTPTQL